MMTQNQAIERAMQAKAKYEQELMERANVVGVGIGFKYKNGQPTDVLAVVTNVTQKKSLADLAQEDVVPTELDGVPTDVQEVGIIKAL
jgi:hypothetical protein